MPNVFITGSGRRIGKALAMKFADKGYDVAVHYNNSREGAEDAASQIRAMGRSASVVTGDVRSEDQMRSALTRAATELGGIDVLVNNAGVFPPPTPISELSVEEWDRVLNINLRGEMICSKIFAGMAVDGARIINFASLGALEIWKHRIQYNVSKAGVVQLTRALARELAPRISVNCVAPGAILVPDEPNIHESEMAPARKIPMNRYGTPDDIFDAVYFFATCSSYITGQTIAVDGGYHYAH
ncbi:MAG: SDR family NAD(P)-dependent oxidoreductase [Candidatus Kapaibacterium sp.]